MENPFELISKRLTNIEARLLDIQFPEQKTAERPLDINKAAEITGLKKSTLYSYTQNNMIPFHKKGNRLYFFESELLEWIKK